MRLVWIGFVVASTLAAGCTVSSGSSSSPTPTPHEPTDGDRDLAGGTLPPTPPKATPPDDGSLREIVHVYMTDKTSRGWYCTGTLVSERTVVTAAHCLDPSKFKSYEIVAALVPGAPRVRASLPKTFGGTFEDVANPDIGFLTLEKAVVLPRYAELTDVVEAVESGAEVMAAAIVRTDQQYDAPFAEAAHLPVTSTVAYGYEYGFGTPMFTKGGDSGAGLFLVENGKLTHKLIGVARQPEPERDLDHFTRIGAPFMQWYAANAS